MNRGLRLSVLLCCFRNWKQRLKNAATIYPLHSTNISHNSGMRETKTRANKVSSHFDNVELPPSGRKVKKPCLDFHGRPVNPFVLTLRYVGALCWLLLSFGHHDPEPVAFLRAMSSPSPRAMGPEQRGPPDVAEGRSVPGPFWVKSPRKG